MIRGLFGKRTAPAGGAFNMDGMQVDMGNVPTTAGGRFGNPMPAMQQEKPASFWQGGNKFTGRDALAGALAAIGDGLRGWSGGPTGAVEGLMASRMAPQQQAAALAAEQRKRAAELADYEAKKGIDQRYAPPKINDTVADFEWFKNLSPEDRAIYQEMRPEYRQGPDGRFYRVDVAQQGGADAPETLPADFFAGGTAGNGGGSFPR